MNGTEMYVNAITPANDQCARITIGTFTGSGVADVGVFVRGVPGQRTFAVAGAKKGGGTFGSQVYLRLNGAVTVLANEDTTVWGQGDVLERCGVGTTYTLKRNGTTVLTASNSGWPEEGLV
jgi:hypothetical protein